MSDEIPIARDRSSPIRIESALQRYELNLTKKHTLLSILFTGGNSGIYLKLCYSYTYEKGIKFEML